MNSEPIFIPLDKLRVPASYQRAYDAKRAKDMAAHWCAPLAGVLSVSPIEQEPGYFYVWEGQHRLGAMRLQGFEGAWCQSTPMSEAEQASLFVRAQTQRRAISVLDRHRALLVANDEKAEAIEKILKDLGLHFAPGRHATEYGISAVAAVYRAYGSGGPHLRNVLWVCQNAWPGEASAFNQVILAGVDKFLRAYPNIEPGELAERLTRVSPVKLVRDAAAMAQISDMDAPGAVAKGILSVFNFKRRARRLDDLTRERHARAMPKADRAD